MIGRVGRWRIIGLISNGNFNYIHIHKCANFVFHGFHGIRGICMDDSVLHLHLPRYLDIEPIGLPSVLTIKPCLDTWNSIQRRCKDRPYVPSSPHVSISTSDACILKKDSVVRQKTIRNQAPPSPSSSGWSKRKLAANSSFLSQAK